MSGTLYLQRLGEAPQAFDPDIHFAMPELAHDKVILIGDKKETLAQAAEADVDAKLFKVATVFNQGFYRVDATIQAASEVHRVLRDTVAKSFATTATTLLEAEAALLTFVTQVKAKLEKTIKNPFTLLGGRMYGGIMRLAELEQTLAKEVALLKVEAQKEQVDSFGSFLLVMSSMEATITLKKVLREQNIKNAFMLRMQPHEPNIIYVVEGCPEQNDHLEIVFPFQESVIILHNGVYTLKLQAGKPQHATFEGVENGVNKNEWRSLGAMLSALRRVYGPSLSRAASRADSPGAPALPSQAQPNSEALPLQQRPPAFVLASTPRNAPLQSELDKSPRALESPSQPVVILSLQKAIEAGLCLVKPNPFEVSSKLNKHPASLKVTQKGPVNFLFVQDAKGALFLEMLYCTSIDGKCIQLEFEIKGSSGKYILSDAEATDGRKWPHPEKEWASFAEMLKYFQAHCRTPIIS